MSSANTFIVKSVGLLERDKIIGTAIHHSKLRRVIVLKGNKGAGKTELLKAVALRVAERSKYLPIVIFDCSTFKPFVMDIFYQLYNRELLHPDLQEREWDELYKVFNKAHAKEALHSIYQSFHGNPELILIIDNVDQATKRAGYILRHLLDHHEPPRIITTASSLVKLDFLTWQGEVLDIQPLSKSATTKIVNAYILEKKMTVENLSAFRAQIYQTSAGQPLAIRDLLKYCRYEPLVKRHLLTGRDRSSGRTEMSMWWLIIPIFVIAMMSRYIARSLGDTHLYMMASITAALSIGIRFVLMQGEGGNSECHLLLTVLAVRLQSQ